MSEEQQSKSDIAAILGYLPAITGVAVLVLSIFNIGYFSKIGLHFLGVMDLSNFVYSLSFIIAILTGSLGVYFWGDYVESLLKNIGSRSGRRKIYWVVGVFFGTIAVVVLAARYFFPPLHPSHFLSDRLVAIPAVVFGALLLASQYSHWKATGRVGIGDGFFSFILVVLATYWVGRAVAEHEIYSVKTTYDFVLKDRTVPLTGKLLRASSSGFIVFSENKIGFLPLGEVKQIRGSDELSDW
ncbi:MULTISPECIES: hypothetical protein [unclassified Bradyrhizobium]|uniref:hypothetical protein n=1 Tax=unclassified Bradyrhizobium TaxID=2631580 RepID=UPI001BACE3BA|nr:MULTISPECIES: hypothetical protein [unclassified Bradyrhizobium]WLA52342.1 hypothetical protein QIH80_20975 [Bradyrhizobium elkanii]MBR1206993.1 hypothetical protein [Bradyrhizobium sp. AUGA SZCCT0124]MBR1313532.1 hypothetical protein [Bradyrhizobium sp. AUGA SZCCT0051]MBR1343371.1 hypothetical protein [Bradyrhizobium sp. AUGA SZCCT0105]MBR1357209.1 hypothetical protein [Bradyrhizobium sp. AUGA SZCCT0045]